MMKLGIVVQARLGSTRFPGKILNQIAPGVTVIQQVLSNIFSLELGCKVIVATTTSKLDDDLCDYLEENFRDQISVYRGSEENVLQRFIEAAHTAGLDYVLRICSDNPFINPAGIKELIDLFESHPADYYSYFYKGKPVIRTHFGLFGEIVAVKALEKVSRITANPEEIEHVTNGVYMGEHFELKYIDLSDKLGPYGEIRLTLDTRNDFQVLMDVYEKGIQYTDHYYDVLRKVAFDSSLLTRMAEQIKLNNK